MQIYNLNRVSLTVSSWANVSYWTRESFQEPTAASVHRRSPSEPVLVPHYTAQCLTSALSDCLPCCGETWHRLQGQASLS